jgi:hypothetical protein
MQESVENWRRRWKKFQRAMRSRQWRYRHGAAVRRILLSAGLFILIEAILFLAVIIIGYGLLDARTFVSVVTPEVGIAVILYYFLGQSRREHLSQIADTMDVYDKVSHLRLFTFSVWGEPLYYVENTATKQAYRASDFIGKIIDQNILEPVVCRSEREMRRILRKNGTKLNEREPSLAELFNKQAESL